jgi:hypothetical protein
MFPMRRLSGANPFPRKCTHRSEIRDVHPQSEGCEECQKSGSRWVQLRKCATCGKVGCCDNSPNQHARKHFEQTGHPIVASAEPGEDWLWCLVDEMLIT